MHVPILNFKTSHFASWGRSQIAVGILLLYLRFSLLLSLSQFPPIFVLFVDISDVLCHCFKANFTLTGPHYTVYYTNYTDYDYTGILARVVSTRKRWAWKNKVDLFFFVPISFSTAILKLHQMIIAFCSVHHKAFNPYYWCTGTWALGHK